MTLNYIHQSSIINAINQTKKFCVFESRHLTAEIRNSIDHLMVDNTEMFGEYGK